MATVAGLASIDMRLKIKSIIKDTLIIIAITLLILGILEMSLRFIYYEIPFYESHPVYLRQLSESKQYTFVHHKDNGGDTVVVKTNADRFRGNPLKRNPSKRVMIYGDSNIQVRFSTQENTLAGKLETKLNEHIESDIEVINAGVIGYGPDQILLRIKEEIPKYRSDIIVFHVFAGNDVGDILRNRLLKLDNNGNLIEYGQVKRQVRKSFLSLLTYRVQRKIASKFNKKPKDHSSLFFQWVNKEYSIYIDPSKVTPIYGDHYDIDVATDTTLASSKLKIKLLRAILKEASEFTKNHNVRLMVLIQPSIVDISHNYILNYDYLRKEYPYYRKTNLTKVVEDICLDNSILYLNLYDTFINNNPNDLYFVANNNHWNDLGQELAARELTNYILKNDLIEP